MARLSGRAFFALFQFWSGSAESGLTYLTLFSIDSRMARIQGSLSDAICGFPVSLEMEARAEASSLSIPVQQRERLLVQSERL